MSESISHHTSAPTPSFNSTSNQLPSSSSTSSSSSVSSVTPATAADTSASTSHSQQLPPRYRVTNDHQIHDTDGTLVPANLYVQLRLLLWDADQPTPARELKVHPNYKARTSYVLLHRIRELTSPSLELVSPAVVGLESRSSLDAKRRAALRNCLRLLRAINQEGLEVSLALVEQNGNQVPDEVMYAALHATQPPDADQLAQAESAVDSTCAVDDDDAAEDENSCADCATQSAVNNIRVSHGYSPLPATRCENHTTATAFEKIR